MSNQSIRVDEPEEIVSRLHKARQDVSDYKTGDALEHIEWVLQRFEGVKKAERVMDQIEALFADYDDVVDYVHIVDDEIQVHINTYSDVRAAVPGDLITDLQNATLDDMELDDVSFINDTDERGPMITLTYPRAWPLDQRSYHAHNFE